MKLSPLSHIRKNTSAKFIKLISTEKKHGKKFSHFPDSIMHIPHPTPYYKFSDYEIKMHLRIHCEEFCQLSEKLVTK